MEVLDVKASNREEDLVKYKTILETKEVITL
jgi:hypothetical protein